MESPQPPITMALEASPSEADIQSVWNGLISYNRAFVAEEREERLTLFLRAPDGTIMGGLLGGTFWSWLHVGILWVHESLRGQGHGTALLQAAEAEAVRRGCHSSYLDTMSFQARPFYERLGYSLFGELADFPPGHRRYFVQKRLVP